MGYTSLHNHTCYSLLDGAARIEELVLRAKDLGMDALAITDHGNMFGAIEFYRECKKHGIRPVIGCEVYTAPRSRFDKDSTLDRKSGHMILLAENDTGYHNLMKIVSEGYRNGFYRKPRIDTEVLRECSEGIIATSACIAGDIPRRLLADDYDGAKKKALEYLDIFGEGNFFLEVQDHGLEEEVKVIPLLRKLSEDTGIPLIAANDVHYVSREDAKVQDALMCIQTASTMQDTGRIRFEGDQYYLKSEEEMRKIFAWAPEAVDNTQKIAERCSVEFEFGKLHLPDFAAPDGMENGEYLRNLCRRGLMERYPKEWALHIERLDYELDTIESMGYVEYFLIVWDFINYAKSRGIMVGPGRGSAAGSIVAYTLHITDIDPIRYGLIFERFLNPERVSMPDIDIDFCYERRGEVVEYVREKYGKDNVSQITSLGTMKARQAVRDMGRVLGVSYQKTDAIATAIPQGDKLTIKKALESVPEFAAHYMSGKQEKELIEMAMAVEGMPRHASTHAAGIVISGRPLDEYVPLYRGDKGLATQFDMTTIEELGLLKMDFLGLKNLTIIRDALRMIRENHGVDIDFLKMEMDDPKVYELIRSGNTQGVFQLEGAGITDFMKRLRPDCFEDIVAGISLYRPGPMAFIPDYIKNKQDPEHIEYLHESLRPILQETYGCIVYQEQVMKIVRSLGGYTYGQADLVRRAMSKKKMKVMLQEKEHFTKGCAEKGIPQETAEKIFEQMISFAEYAFNKAHAASYAVISYRTAYLKAYYPVEFMAALMSSVMNETASLSAYIRNCRDMGIEVLPPDVLKSEKKFSAEGGKVRYGLLAVKNVGSGAVDSILQARKEHAVRDLVTFAQWTDLRLVNRRAVESLIKSGAFTFSGKSRAACLAACEAVLEQAHKSARNTLQGQTSLFDMEDISGAMTSSIEDRPEFQPAQLAAMEKEALGLYLTAHPLEEFRDLIAKKSTVSSYTLRLAAMEAENGTLSEYGRKNVHTGAGMIESVKTLITKKGEPMAFAELEDLHGVFELVIFPEAYRQYGKYVREGERIFAEGTIEINESSRPKMLVRKIYTFEEARQIAPKKKASPKPEAKASLIKVRIPESAHAQQLAEQVYEELAGRPGKAKVRIYFPDGECMTLQGGRGADPTPALRSALVMLLGKENVKFI